jgi:nucleoside transporter
MNNNRSPFHVRLRLSIMMFFQYAIWGAWLPLLFQYVFHHLQWTPDEFGIIAALGACGALVAPFISGQIADRYFSTERFLAVSHGAGGVLVWLLATLEPNDFTLFCIISFFYGMIYAPTIPLTNSISFHHLKSAEKEFGRVRVWGTIGWIVVGILMGHWLLHLGGEGATGDGVAARYAGMADCFKLSAILGWILALFCLFLPHTPPQPSKERSFAPLAAMGELKKRALWVLFLVAFPISVVHQFYFVHTAKFINETVEGSIKATQQLEPIFGWGGASLMTLGQIAEIVVLALMPLILKRWSKKQVLSFGLLAYILRFLVFAYLPYPEVVVPALALHGFCFGCFIFVAFIIVDEECGKDVRASAQGLFNFVVIGIGIIVGNLFAGEIGSIATLEEGGLDYQLLFTVPLVIAVISFLILWALYPKGKKSHEP